MTGMQKSLTMLILALVEIIDVVWGENLFGHLTEETLGVIVAALFPIIVWFVPQKD
jgi:hypothetical protein